MMKKCTNCGAALLKDARFCSECGNEIQKDPVPVCPACGTQSNAEDLFCTVCGTALAPSTTSKSTQQQREKPKSQKVQKSKTRKSASGIKVVPQASTKKGSGRKWLKVVIVAGVLFILYQLIPWSSFNNGSGWTGVGYTEESTNPNDPAGLYNDPAFEQARQEYLEAYERYTELATQGGEGDVQEALKEYQAKYERYVSLMKNKRESIYSGSSSNRSKTAISSNNSSLIPAENLPHVTLSTPDGALIEIPGRVSILKDSIVWTTRMATEQERQLGFKDRIYKFKNVDLLKIQGKSILKIPVGQDVQSIWFKGAMGSWVSLNYKFEEHAKSKKYAVFTIDSESSPWDLALSTKAFDPDIFTPLMADLYLFEQNMIQNRSGLNNLDLDKLRGNLFRKPQKMSMFYTGFMDQDEKEWVENLINLYKMLRSVGLQEKISSNQWTDEPFIHWATYKLGIDELVYLKKMSLTKLDKVNLMEYLFREDFNQVLNHSDDKLQFLKITSKTSDWVEWLGAHFAPWGIELTHELIPIIEQNDKQYVNNFLACLYDQSQWVDIPLSDNQINEKIRSEFFNKYKLDSETSKSSVMRMYSTSAVEYKDLIHRLAKFSNNYLLRWAPVILAAAMMASTGITPGLALTFFFNLAWAGLEYGAEEYSVNVSTGEPTSEFIMNVNLGTLAGQPAFKNGVIMLIENNCSIDFPDFKGIWNLADLDWEPKEVAISALLAYILHQYGDEDMERLQRMTDARKSYDGIHLPPILINNYLSGTKYDNPDGYLVNKVYSAAYLLDVEKIYSNNWYRNYGNQAELNIKPNDIISKDRSAWKLPYGYKGSNPTDPHRQLIRVNLSKNLIEYRLSSYDQDKGKDWSKIDLKDLDLIIRIRSKTGDFEKMVPLLDVTTEKDLNGNQRSSIVDLNFQEINAGGTPQYSKELADYLFGDNRTGTADIPVPYIKVSTHARTMYLIEVGFEDNYQNFHPISESMVIDFTNLWNEKDRLLTSEKSNVLMAILEAHRSFRFNAKHRLTSGRDILYNWDIVNTKPLKPLSNEVTITGQVYKLGSKPFSMREGVEKQTISVQVNNQEFSTLSDAEGYYQIIIPCKKGKALITCGEEQKRSIIEDCPSTINADFILPEIEMSKNEMICTYLSEESKRMMESEGWVGQMDTWVKKSNVGTGRKGGKRTYEGEWQEPLFEENLWAEAYITCGNLGVNMDNFKEMVSANTTVLPGTSPNAKQTQNFRQTTIAGLRTEIFEINLTLPSYIQNDTIFNINGGIEKIEKHWEGGGSERLMYLGVEGKPKSNMLIIQLNIKSGVSNPSSINTNVEKELFEKLFDEATSTIHKWKFYTGECSGNISF